MCLAVNFAHWHTEGGDVQPCRGTFCGSERKYEYQNIPASSFPVKQEGNWVFCSLASAGLTGHSLGEGRSSTALPKVWLSQKAGWSLYVTIRKKKGLCCPSLEMLPLFNVREMALQLTREFGKTVMERDGEQSPFQTFLLLHLNLSFVFLLWMITACWVKAKRFSEQSRDIQFTPGRHQTSHPHQAPPAISSWDDLDSNSSTKLLFSPLQKERQCRRSDRSTGHHEAEQKKEQGLV